MPYASIFLLLFFASGSVDYRVPFLFILIGGFLFVMGFRKYRQYRLLEDIPRATVRSIPMGLVHLNGKPTGESRLTSPLTHTPCYYYRLLVERWRSDADNKSDWQTVRSEQDQRTFYLDDGTGKVFVNPDKAEFNLGKTFQAETGHGASGKRYVDPALGVTGPSEQELLDYMQRAHDEGQAKLDALPDSKGKTIARMFVGASGGSSKRERLRFTEECLVAERPCNILGTCEENPAPKDDSDRNMIRKGTNERTFVISDKAEGALEKNVRRQALIMILVGGALIVGIVVFVIGANGWF